MLWDIHGASQRSGENVTVTVHCPSQQDAEEIASGLGILVSSVRAHEPPPPQQTDQRSSTPPAPTRISGPVEVLLSKGQLRALRRVNASDIGLGVFYGLMLWTLFWALIFVGSFVLLGYSLADAANR